MAAVKARVNQLKFNLDQPTSISNLTTNASEPQPILMRKPLDSEAGNSAGHFSYIDLDRLANFQVLARRELDRIRANSTKRPQDTDDKTEKDEINTSGSEKPSSVSAPQKKAGHSHGDHHAKLPQRRNVRLCEKETKRTLQQHGPVSTSSGSKITAKQPSKPSGSMPMRSNSPPVRDTDDWRPSSSATSVSEDIPMKNNRGVTETTNGMKIVERRLQDTINAMNEMQIKFETEQKQMKSLLHQLVHSSSSSTKPTGYFPQKDHSDGSKSKRPKGNLRFERTASSRLYPHPDSYVFHRRAPRSSNLMSVKPRLRSSSPTASNSSTSDHYYSPKSVPFYHNGPLKQGYSKINTPLPMDSASDDFSVDTREERQYSGYGDNKYDSIESPTNRTFNDYTTDKELDSMTYPGWRQDHGESQNTLPNVDEILSRLDQLCAESAAIHRRWPTIHYEDELMSLSTSLDKLDSLSPNMDTWLTPSRHSHVDLQPKMGGLVFTKAPEISLQPPREQYVVNFKNDASKLNHPPSGTILKPDKTMVHRLLDHRDEFEEYMRRKLSYTKRSSAGLIKEAEGIANEFLDEILITIVDELESANEEMVDSLIQQEGLTPNINNDKSPADYSYSIDEDFS